MPPFGIQKPRMASQIFKEKKIKTKKCWDDVKSLCYLTLNKTLLNSLSIEPFFEQTRKNNF